MHRFKNILVYCDEQGGFANLLERVAWLANANEATVALIDVVETTQGGLAQMFAEFGDSGPEVADELLAARRAGLEQIAAQLSGMGVKARTIIAQGSSTLEIVRQVLREEHDLVMKAVQPEPDWPLLKGLDMHLIRKCPSAVWIVKSSAPPRAERILAAVDPDPSDAVRNQLNRTVLQLATSLAARDEAALDVINAWWLTAEATLRRSRAKVPPPEVDQLVESHRRTSEWRMSALVAEFSETYPDMRTFHVKGRPTDVIPNHALSENVDTIVMGTVARTGVHGFFIGNTAETILSRVNCSVLTVKPEGFASPITLHD